MAEAKQNRMNFIYRFFCWAGGGYADVLQEMPTERNRFFGYGTVICMTAIFATLSSSYAFWLLLHEQIGAFILAPALAWGAFIFILDRFFITTISNRGSFGVRLLSASPRLILAIFIGVLISKPLEFRIFQREISDQLIALKTQEYDMVDSLHRERIDKLNRDKEIEISKMSGGQEIAPLADRIKEWKGKLPVLEKDIKAQAEKVNCECNGACGTNIPGRGRACKFEETEHKRLLDEQKKVKTDIQNAEARIETIKAGLQTQIEQTISPKYQARADSLEHLKELLKVSLDANFKPSILNQQIALAKIQEDPEKPTAFYTVWFITLLFIFIEMAPMLLKLMTSAGAYESRIAQIEAAYSTEGRLRRTLDLEEYKSNRGLVQHLARDQRKFIKMVLDGYKSHIDDDFKHNPEKYYESLHDENVDNQQ